MRYIFQHLVNRLRTATTKTTGKEIEREAFTIIIIIYYILRQARKNLRMCSKYEMIYENIMLTIKES